MGNDGNHGRTIELGDALRRGHDEYKRGEVVMVTQLVKAYMA